MGGACRWSTPGLAALLLVGCGFDLGALRGDAGPALDGGTVAPAVDAGPPPPDAGVPPPPPPPPDAGPGTPPAPDAGGFQIPDAGPPPCGRVGLECCRAGDPCSEGGCLRGRCTSFAGVTVETLTCEPTCATRNPFTAGCGCPLGFETQRLVGVDGQCGTASTFLDLGICRAASPAADWGGAYLEACGACVGPNLRTEACACPTGARSILLATTYEGCAATLVLCQGIGPSLFAGAYQQNPGSLIACVTPNPETGACSCPEGSIGQGLPLRADGASRPATLCTREDW
jgi:hypothetical protein